MPASWQGVKAQTYVNQMLRWWQSRRSEREREKEHWREEWGVKRKERLLKTEWERGEKWEPAEEEGCGEKISGVVWRKWQEVLQWFIFLLLNHCWESISLTEGAHTISFRSLNKKWLMFPVGTWDIHTNTHSAQGGVFCFFRFLVWHCCPI